MKIIFINIAISLLILLIANFSFEKVHLKKRGTYSWEKLKEEKGYKIYQEFFSLGKEQVFSYKAKYQYYKEGTHFRVPLNKSNKSYIKQVVLIGGSFIEGEGLEDSETFAHLLQEELENTEVKTLAKKGWAFTNFLALLLSNHPIYNKVDPNKETLFIYAFPQFHGKRIAMTYGKFLTHPFRQSMYPYFSYTGKEPSFETYQEKFPLQVFSLKALHTLNLLREPLYRFIKKLFLGKKEIFFHSDHKDGIIPPLLASFSAKLNERFSKSKFAVLQYPFHELPDHYKDHNSYKLIDLKRPSLNKSNYFIKVDNHPTKMMNQYLANNLSRVLKLKGFD